MSDGTRLDRLGSTSYTAADLVSMAADGEIRVPTFQRQYVWDDRDVRNLFDSIFRTFPIGTLLLWKRHAAAGKVALGPIQFDVPEASGALWVVDGQQRVTSLFGALAPGHAGVDDRFEVYFDLRSRRFVTARRGVVPAHAIPVREALDSRSLLNWIRRNGDDLEGDDLETVDKLGGALRDYKIPVYVVTGDDQNLLREVFDRVNSAGKPISRAQVFHALFAREGEPGSPRSVVSALATLGFGSLEENRVVQSVLAIRGGNFQRDLHDEFQSDEDPAEWYDKAEAALTRVIQFLRAQGVPHLGLMPNTLAIPALAAFFHLHPEPEAWTVHLLSRWLWRGWVHGFGRESGQTPILRRVIQSIHPEHRNPDAAPGEFEAVKSLLDFTPDREAPPVNLLEFNTKSGNQRLILLALATLNPLNRGGVRIDLAGEFESRGSAAVGEYVPRHRTNAAARGFWIGEASFHAAGLSDEVLASHLISAEAALALASNEPDEFLRVRGAALADLTSRFLNVRVAPGTDVRPSIQAMLELGRIESTMP
ncbi:MAG TPA: DUF262 domain-containing protein [Sporichthyaceae bacterium]|jgi:hypothetical protein|nr:DUF262 domain-containing protein [Sporichthyaceae bacterium]